MIDQVFSVSEALAVINQTLEFAYPEVIIEGEVSSFKVNQGKWVFFDIKDHNSSLGCFLPVFQLKAPLEDGMLVRVHVQPKLTAWGKFSLTVRSIELAGEGSVKKSFELLRATLEKEGLFAEERKRDLPRYPQRIALITSKQAAAYTDFVTILNDRWAGVQVDHLQVQVQGEAAPDQIAQAVTYCSGRAEYDAVVIIRGGGSAEDLQAFQTEPVVRAIYGCTVPTLVAIGHEDDVCLAELVADKRCATPTDAARQLVPDKKATINNLEHIQNNMAHTALHSLQEAQKGLVAFSHSMHSVLQATASRVQELETSLVSQIERLTQKKQGEFAQVYSQLLALDPQAILQRGYALVTKNNTTIHSSHELKVKDDIMIQLAQGKVGAKVFELTEDTL